MSTANSQAGSLPQRLLDTLQEIPSPEGYLIALSGGLDSVVLLHAMVAIRTDLDLPLRAVHVDHGLHPASSEWSAHCRDLCRELDVPLVQLRVDVPRRTRASPEELAREARYRAISGILRHREMLLLAQHGDDQAETFLLQLLRGAGVEGLAAMPRVRSWQCGWMARPLLGFTRAELEQWAGARGLSWIEDPSNLDTGIARNYLRHQVLPLLRRRWPALAGTIGRSAAHCAEAAEILREVAEADLEKSCPSPWQLSLPALQQLSRARQRNLLRHWLRSRGVPVPSRKVLESILEQGSMASGEAAPHLRWKGGEIRRYRDRLYLFPGALPEFPGDLRLSWSGNGALSLPEGLGSLSLVGERPGWFPWSGVEVIFRGEGARCRPSGRQGTRSFKKYCQEFGIPPWLRPLLPLVLVDGKLAAIADYGFCEPFSGPPAIVWERSEWLR